jgi:hypothetical protein
MTPIKVSIAATIVSLLLLAGVFELIRFLFVICVLLHYSTVISRLTDQNVVLAQRLALLETRLKERERAAGPD